jgi:branched-chain amino acid transport system ATP-binding protein
MLSMAQALLAKPKLCMFDEPSSGLAPLIVHQVFEAIRRLADGGTTVLMVEQNARAALAMADYAYVMEQGRIALRGRAREISADDHVRRAYLGL